MTVKALAKKIRDIFQRQLSHTTKNQREPDLSMIDFEDVARQLTRPWIEGSVSELWDVMSAVRVILDDGHRLIEAEQRQGSAKARNRAVAAQRLVEAAQALVQSGVPIPQRGDKPPKTQQALARANGHYRDWKAAFDIVAAALRHAGWKKVGKATPTAPAIAITCDVLEQIGIVASPDALVKMLQRTAEEGYSLTRMWRHEQAQKAPSNEKDK